MDYFEKQIVRKWLIANSDETGELATLPPEISNCTAARYCELIDRLRLRRHTKAKGATTTYHWLR